MKKISYNSPTATVITCSAPDVLNGSVPSPTPYTLVDSSSGEWLDWGEIK